MLQQIVMKTPLWVWAILAFLLYRGMLASVDREIAFKKVFIIPVVMLGLSLQGIASGFGAAPVAMPVWLLSMLAGAVLAWRGLNTEAVSAHPARGVVFQRGSWMPLALMMGIFCTKYAVGVTLALHPALRQHAPFAAGVCMLYGLFSGIFVGRALRTVALYRRAQATSVPNAADASNAGGAPRF